MVVAGGAITCDSPTGPQRRMARLSFVPVFSVNASQFAGLTVDNVRLTAVRPPSETLAVDTIPFPADSQAITANFAVPVSGTETLTVYIELLAGTTVMFTGSQSVVAIPGQTASQPQPIPVAYNGPGSNVATLAVAPLDSGAAYGAQIPFRVTARDSSNNPVASFYVGWSTSNSAHTINANGVFTAGNGRATVWVYAHTPTGIWDSTRITVAPAPTAVQIVSGNNQSANAGNALGQPLVVRVIGQDNGPVVGIQVTFAAVTGGGSVNPTSAVTDMQGEAQTIATVGAGGTNTFSASAPGLSSATFTATATAAAPPQLEFTTQPASSVAGVAIPAIAVRARDPLGNTVAFTGDVTLAISSNPGGGTLSGTATVATTTGVASFPGLSINKSGIGYTLQATATGGPTAATSAAFNISAAAATTLSLVSGGGQAGAPSAQLPQPVVVAVTDAFGNGVSGVPVSFAVATGGGSVGTASANTNAQGQASTTWTLGATLGAQTIEATSTGLTGSPLTVTASASSIVATTVTPQIDTITAINGTRTVVAQARDAQSNPVSGTFTWLSRDPAIASVSASGVVTALANGTTYIVATEAGGTRDSARVTVEQRMASITVSPAARNIYLTRNFTFTATAVDGLGTPIPNQPAFTWTSTAPAIAEVPSATSGLVNAVGLGSAQIRATSGTVIGVASVQVITPITRIVVSIDTVGAATTDTFTMVSLGLTRTYQAVARDTLDAVMTGISFTWQSSNASVASLDNVTATTARATSQLNGITDIRATAQGFTSAPGARLIVSQVLASIELSPPASNPTATIAPTGTMTVVARGKDANGRYIPGGTFAFASSASAVATVNASTGQVTGVANGTADITATSGAITSNALLVTVGGAVPAIISFGRDTISVGRGSAASIPILLSRPHTADLTVNLAVADTFAFWSQASVVIPQGATSVNATLNGRNAGNTTVTATDGSGAGYTAGSAVAAVTANMNLQHGNFDINTTDIVASQVRLSDPSPSGGTYVNFVYGTPGIAQVSPDPAFIPAGQLAADIQIRAVAPGTTTITPNAVGVNGAASNFTSRAPVLTPSTSFIQLGQGQFEPNVYVYTPTSTNVAVPVTLTSSDTTVVTVTPSVTIPGGSYYAYFTATARGIGQASISMASPGWTASGTITVRSSTPRVGVCCGGSLFTTSPPATVTVYAEDSTQNVHNRTNSLLVHLRSTDTTVLRMLDTVATIAPGTYYSQTARAAPAGLGGSAYVVVTASGHQPDSVLYTVVGPPLVLSFSTVRLGAGQYEPNVYVYTPNNVAAPLTVTLANPDSNIAGTPPTVTIPAGTYYAYFTVRGKVPGSVTLTASAPGYNNASGNVDVTSPRITMSGGTTLNAFAPSQTYYVYATDSLGNAHNRSASLHVSLVSSNPAAVTTDTSAVIPADNYYTTTPPQVTPVGVGSAQINAAAAGHRPDSTTFTVQTPKLNFSTASYQIGRRQYRPEDQVYLYVPNTRVTPLDVTIARSAPAVDSAPGLVTIPAGTYYRYFGFAGLTNGRDTLIASAPGYQPDTMVIIVSTPRLTASGLPGNVTTTNPPFTVYVYAADSSGSNHYVSDTVVVQVLTSDSAVIRPALQYIRIPQGQPYKDVQVSVVGPGTASITFSDSAGTGYQPVTTNTVTVTGPSLTLNNGTPMLGMRQHDNGGRSYVSVPNTVASPLVVNLVSTDTRVVTVPASVTIPAGSYYAYFQVTAQDTLGTIQIQATATGYSPAAMNVQVTQPRFIVSTASQLNTTSGPYPITVYAADQNGNLNYTTEAVTVSLLSTAPSVAVIDSGTVTIPAGSYYHNTARWSPGIEGTSQIQASDQRAALYQYAMGTVNVSVVTPSLNLSWGTETLGIGQYVEHYVTRPDYPNPPLTVSLTHTGTPRVGFEPQGGGASITQVTIDSTTYYRYFRIVGLSAGTDTTNATATSPPHNPDVAYVVVGQGTIGPLGSWPANLAVGDSVAVTLYPRDPSGNNRNVNAATTFTLTPNANIEFRSGGAVITQVIVPAGGSSVSFYVRALSSGPGSASISATNYQTYNTPTVNVP